MFDIKINVNLSDLKNKSILITGASGLLGLYFLSSLKLIQKKYNIKIYAWIKNNIEDYYDSFFKDFYIIKEDITDIKIFDSLPNFDFIIHSAGYGQPNKFLNDKIKTIEINTLATINLLNKLNEDGKFLFISTSELYSGLNNMNINENQVGITNTNHPRSSYIEGKRCGESICYSSNKNVKIARLSLAYGPGTKRGDARVINALIEKGIKNKNIQLIDKGESIRTYCYITDVIEILWNIFLHSNEILYNVGGVSTLSILELSKIIGEYLDKDVKITSTNSLVGSPMIVNMSIDKYMKEFNKKDFVSIEKGIIETIEWQKTIYEN